MKIETEKDLAAKNNIFASCVIKNDKDCRKNKKDWIYPYANNKPETLKKLSIWWNPWGFFFLTCKVQPWRQKKLKHFYLSRLQPDFSIKPQSHCGSNAGIIIELLNNFISFKYSQSKLPREDVSFPSSDLLI